MVKKLMMMVAAVTMVGVAQAASTTWTIYEMPDGSAGATGYLLYQNQTQSWAAQVAAMDSTTVDTVLAKLNSNAIGTLTIGSNRQGTGDVTFTKSAEDVFGSEDILNIIVISADKTKYLTGSIYEVSFAWDDGYTDEYDVYHEDYQYTNYSYTVPSGTSWSSTSVSTAVPEPTSGLLLLVGGALLALRRRRLR